MFFNPQNLVSILFPSRLTIVTTKDFPIQLTLLKTLQRILIVQQNNYLNLHLFCWPMIALAVLIKNSLLMILYHLPNFLQR